MGITALSYGFFLAFGAIRLDLSGQEFLRRLAEQFAAVGQNMEASLPPGFTPQMMLLIYFIGGLTVFNIMPGLITGFGEEFGHRGFMFPALYRIKPWVGIFVVGFIWYAWHLPLALVIPQTAETPLWQSILNFVILGVGSLCTFAYLAYVYVKTRSVWVAAFAHIVMNNSGSAFSYFAVVQNQLLANLGLMVAMVIVAVILIRRNALGTFAEYFRAEAEG
jgi:membrane protease YdiL (CAAX protease family)